MNDGKHSRDRIHVDGLTFCNSNGQSLYDDILRQLIKKQEIAPITSLVVKQ